MAAFKVLKQEPSRLVIGKGKSGLTNLISLLIFGGIALVGLSSLFGDGSDLNPVTFVVIAIIIIIVGIAFIGALRGTTVTLDAGQGTASRTDSVLGFPISRHEMAFNLIRDIQVAFPVGMRSWRTDVTPMWQVQLRGTDGSNLVVNERGTRSEMNGFAQQVRTVVNRPITGPEQAVTTEQPVSSPPSTDSVGRAVAAGNLLGSLSALGKSIATATPSTFSAFPSVSGGGRATTGTSPSSPDAPYVQTSAQFAQQQAAAEAGVAQTSARMAQEQAQAGASSAQASATLLAQQMQAQQSDAAAAQAFVSAQTNAGMPYAQASAQLAQQQANATYAMGYSTAPVLDLPQLPAMGSFAAPMDMPSLPPLSSSIMPLFVATTAAATAMAVAPEVKQVQARVSPSRSRSLSELQRAAAQDPQDVTAQYALARQLMNSNNWRDARAALERAIGINPADSAVQNDLGVVYLEQNQLPDAERAFRRAMALDPLGSASRYNLGLTLNKMGKRSEAQEQFQLGERNATLSQAKLFQNARQGVLLGPQTSPQPGYFPEDSSG